MFHYRNITVQPHGVAVLKHGGVPVFYSIRNAADLGAVIGAERGTRDWTQEQLAARAAVSRPYLAVLERGRTSRLLELYFDLLRLLDLEVIVRRRGNEDRPVDA